MGYSSNDHLLHFKLESTIDYECRLDAHHGCTGGGSGGNVSILTVIKCEARRRELHAASPSVSVLNCLLSSIFVRLQSLRQTNQNVRVPGAHKPARVAPHLVDVVADVMRFLFRVAPVGGFQGAVRS